MKRTTTKITEVYTPCYCNGNETCILCKGTGKYISGRGTETIVEEFPEPIDNIVEAELSTFCSSAEVALPELEFKEE